MLKDDELFSINLAAKEATCLVCHKKITDLRRYSYHRHYKLMHRSFSVKHGLLQDEDEAGPSRKIPKIEVRTNRKIYTSSLVELVTVHGLPLNVLRYPAFQALTRPIEEGLNIRHINQDSMRNLLRSIAEQITNMISEEAAGIMICIKMDAASRHNRDFLGVNIQFVEKATIKIRTLGIIELHERHTASNLSSRLMAILEPFGIDIQRVLTITTDNASNMLATVNRLRANQEMILNSAHDVDEVYEDDGEEEDRHVEDFENEANEAGAEKTLDIIEPVLQGVRCAEHTLQLAVNDSLKHNNMKSLLAEVRAAVKVLRKLPYKTMFTVSKKTMPKLDCITRWNSAYTMIKSLTKEQDFVSSLSEEDVTPIISGRLWEFIMEFEKVFEPIAEATLKLQNSQTTFGDLFLIWEKCSYKLKNSKYKLASVVLQCMDNRKQQIMSNKIFLASIFFDQRINFRNSPFIQNEEREVALVRKRLHVLLSYNDCFEDNHSSNNLFISGVYCSSMGNIANNMQPKM